MIPETMANGQYMIESKNSGAQIATVPMIASVGPTAKIAFFKALLQ